MDKKESETIEFKKSTSELKEAIISIVSILNKHQKGELYFGIKKDGKVIGQSISEKTLRDISKSISDHVEPKIFPKIHEKEIDNKKCIVIEFEGNNIPYYAYGRAYMRVADEDKLISAKEIERIIIEKNKDKLRWDKEICKDATLKDIDKDKLKLFLKTAKEERNFDVNPNVSVKEGLSRLHLLDKDKITNAAVLLFGKNPQKFFANSKIRCARFKGIDSLDFIDMKVLDGTIPELRDKVMKFVLEHIKHGVYFDANKRYDKWEYPIRAIEEAVTNALAHRDYYSNAEVQLSIFDDKIEIWNPGELLKPLSLEDLKKEHQSIPRNELIADSLFLIRYIEKWGRGTNRIIEEMLEHKLPEPVFMIKAGSFVIRLIGPGKQFEEEIEKEKLHILDINERQKKAIEYIKMNGKITNREYRELFNVSHKTAHLELTDLVREGIVKQMGKGRSVIYRG